MDILIGALGIIVTTTITLYSLRMQKWSENVSKERMKWIKGFRDEVSTIMSVLDYIEICQKNKNPESSVPLICKDDSTALRRALKSKWSLFTRINTSTKLGNEYNERYKQLLRNMDFFSSQVTTYRCEFMNLTNLILEEEWRKVKRESKGDLHL